MASTTTTLVGRGGAEGTETENTYEALERQNAKIYKYIEGINPRSYEKHSYSSEFFQL